MAILIKFMEPLICSFFKLLNLSTRIQWEVIIIEGTTYFGYRTWRSQARTKPKVFSFLSIFPRGGRDYEGIMLLRKQSYQQSQPAVGLACYYNNIKRYPNLSRHWLQQWRICSADSILLSFGIGGQLHGFIQGTLTLFKDLLLMFCWRNHVVKHLCSYS